jgi:hypothetical protein
LVAYAEVTGNAATGGRVGADVIHHLSIPAIDTRNVAEVLRTVLGGQITPFGPYRDSWIVWTGDEHGTAIEVYPMGTQMYPPDGAGQALFRAAEHPSPYVATHAAVSVDRSVEEIHVMLELMTPEMRRDYLAAVPSRATPSP